MNRLRQFGTQWGLIVAVLLGLGGSARASSGTQEVTAQVVVPSTFTLSFNPSSVSFDHMRPGTFSGSKPVNVQFGFEQGLVLTALSNNGHTWQIQMNATTPLSSGAQVIPMSDFQAFGWIVAGEASGTLLRGTAAPVSLSPESIYTSSAAESVNTPNGTKVHMQFQLGVPERQVPGTYTTTLRFTMTE